MPAGFSNYLADGQTIQVDENYKNLELRGKWQLIATNIISYGAPNTYDVYLTVDGLTNPIVAINSLNVYVALISTTVSGGRVTYRFASLNNSVPFTVCVFDNPAPGFSNSGFQVFNSSGQLVFDADKKYLKVVGSYSFADYNAVSIPVPANGVFGYVPSGFLGYFEDYHDAYDTGAPFSVKTKGACFWAVSGTRLIPFTQQFWTGSRGGVGLNSPFLYEVLGGTVQIVDLTGM